MYYLVSTFYFTLKIEESRASSLPFDDFLSLVRQTTSYRDLEIHLNPEEDSEIVWDEQVYPYVERLILEVVLNFKLNFVSSADVIYQIFCTFRAME